MSTSTSRRTAKGTRPYTGTGAESRRAWGEFLAPVLRDELFRRLDNAGVSAEWDDILRDLNALSDTTITYNGKSFAVRSNAVGVAGKIAQCVGVRLPNTVRQTDVETERAEPSD